MLSPNQHIVRTVGQRLACPGESRVGAMPARQPIVPPAFSFAHSPKT